MYSRKRQNRNPLNRRGAAIIELAVVLPVLFLLVFGSIELNQSIYLKQTLTSAAHDGTLVGLRIGASEQDVIDRIEMVLEDRGVVADSISVETETGGLFDTLESGKQFTVVVEASLTRNSLFINLSTVDARITGIRP